MVTKWIGIALSVGVACAYAAAQDAPEATGATHSIDFKSTQLQAALSSVGQQYGVRVISQEGLKGSVTAKASEATIEAALTLVTAPNGLTWRKFVLAVKPSDQVNAKTLDELMTALNTIQFSALVAYEPGQSQGVHVERAIPPGELIGTEAPDGAKYTPFYYVYDARPKPQEKPTAKDKRPTRTFGAAEQPNLSMGQVVMWFNGLAPQMKARLLDEFIRLAEMQGGPEVGPDTGPGDEPEGDPQRGDE